MPCWALEGPSRPVLCSISFTVVKKNEIHRQCILFILRTKTDMYMYTYIYNIKEKERGARHCKITYISGDQCLGTVVLNAEVTVKVYLVNGTKVDISFWDFYCLLNIIFLNIYLCRYM